MMYKNKLDDILWLIVFRARSLEKDSVGSGEKYIDEIPGVSEYNKAQLKQTLKIDSKDLINVEFIKG